MLKLYYKTNTNNSILNTMKKILFVALAATLLAAGCQKTEIINPVGEPSMSFTTGMNKLTKATTVADGTTNLQTQDFSVWAYAAFEDENTTATEMDNIYDHIENLAVTYDETKQGWTTDKEYYWPGVGKDLCFYAVSAKGSWLRPTEGTAPVTVTPGANPSMTIANFTVDAANPNEDLMVADFIQQNQKEKAVALNFHHALSKVEFVFKTNAPATGSTEEAPKVFVQNVKVAGMANVGTLTVTPEAPATPEQQAEGDENAYVPTVKLAHLDWGATATGNVLFSDNWDAAATDFPADIEKVDTENDYGTNALQLTTEPQKFTTWLMLPQSIEGKKVEITYVINKRQFKSIFALETSSLKNWACNQYIKYTIVLAPNVISFNPSVEDWDTATDVGHQN